MVSGQGLIRNLVYLFLFFVVYTITVSLYPYFNSLISGISIFTAGYAAVPSYTWAILDFLWYVMAPIGVVLWFIFSITSPSREEYY